MKIPAHFQQNKSLRTLTTFGIGGPAKYYVEVQTIEQMQETLRFCHENNLSYFVLGKGSNCLFHDLGFDGLIIANRIDFIDNSQDGIFHVGAGYSFSLLGTQTARKGWSGLEFASGIPGSVGGAVFMNAGANGKETCESLFYVDFVTEEGKVIQLSKKRDEVWL